MESKSNLATIADTSAIDSAIYNTTVSDKSIIDSDNRIVDQSRLDAAILSCLICLVTISVFLRVNFIFKLCLMTLTAIVQIVIYACILQQPSNLIEIDGLNTPLPQPDSIATNISSTLLGVNPTPYSDWPAWLEPALLMSLLIILLHLLDRQAELTSRSDFLWMTKLSSEEEGGDTMLGINKV